jgi:uncharacterized protein
MSGAPRVVLDTNLVLSALVFAEGRLTALRHAWQNARCDPQVCQATVDELVRVLAYRAFRLTRDEQQELLADYLPYCSTVRLPAKPPKTPTCPDPFDVPFLQLAIAGEADYLVTDNQDLLSLARKFACPIVTAEQLMTTLAR